MFFNLSNFFGHLQIIDVAESDGEDVSVFMQVYVY
jgi:hypothetical protein